MFDEWGIQNVLKQLNEQGETVLYWGKPSWRVLLSSFFGDWMLWLMIFAWWIFINNGGDGMPQIIGNWYVALLLFVIMLGRYRNAIVDSFTVSYIVTKVHLIQIRGWINTNRNTISLDRIKSWSISYGFWGQVLNYANINWDLGGSHHYWAVVPDSRRFRNSVIEYLQRQQSSKTPTAEISKARQA